MIKSIILFSALFIYSVSCIAQKKSNSKSIPQDLQILDTIEVVDTLFITSSPTPFREKPNIDSKQLKEIPSYFVLISHRIIGNYYEVLLNDTIGYVPIAFVKKHKLEPLGINRITNSESPSSGVITSPNSESTNSKNSSSSSTLKTTTTGCSSSQCSGKTKKGSRCRNITTSCSGRCYLH